MRALTAAEFLEIWERGSRQSPARRALLLLGAACPDETPEALARLSLGRRDARLLRLREAAFGARLEAAATCPRCGEKLEMGFTVDELLAGAADENTLAPHTCELHEHAITFRLPDTYDLLELASVADPERAQMTLLARCVTAARLRERELRADELPARVIDALASRMAEADPHADIQLALNCPACAHRWSEAFDIVTFFWRELDAWALSLLRDVHLLAQAYGWTEAEIVALSPERRRLYLEMIAG
jgi:hypothetical protein